MDIYHCYLYFTLQAYIVLEYQNKIISVVNM